MRLSIGLLHTFILIAAVPATSLPAEPVSQLEKRIPKTERPNLDNALSRAQEQSNTLPYDRDKCTSYQIEHPDNKLNVARQYAGFYNEDDEVVVMAMWRRGAFWAGRIAKSVEHQMYPGHNFLGNERTEVFPKKVEDTILGHSDKEECKTGYYLVPWEPQLSEAINRWLLLEAKLADIDVFIWGRQSRQGYPSNSRLFDKLEACINGITGSRLPVHRITYYNRKETSMYVRKMGVEFFLDDEGNVDSRLYASSDEPR